MRDRYQNSAETNPWSKILIALGAVIFVILIIKFMTSGGPSLEDSPVSLRLSDTTSNAEITSGNNDPKSVTVNTPLTKMDLIEMRNGTGQVAFLTNEKNALNMNTGTKLRYLEEGSDGKSSFRLENKDLWVNADTGSMTFDLVWLTLIPSSTTVMNISKNELFTTISVLQGSASINLGGSLLEIPSGKQLNYSTLKTITIEDLTSRVADINPDTLSTDWMKLNNASAYVTIKPVETTTNTLGTSGGLILFDSPIDESTVETKSITVTGRILSPSVGKIIINGSPATIDPVKQTFTTSPIELTTKENNIVYRTFDVSGGLLSKGIVTVYTTATGLSAGTSTGTSTRAQVETYKPDNRFKIVAPSSDFYETRETKVKLEGRVTSGAAHHITINDFRLSSFGANGTSWYYFANQQFGNMQEWVNTYTIRYFDAQDNEIYKQLFVIKKLPAFTSTGTKPTLTPITPVETDTEKNTNS